MCFLALFFLGGRGTGLNVVPFFRDFPPLKLFFLGFFSVFRVKLPLFPLLRQIPPQSVFSSPPSYLVPQFFFFAVLPVLTFMFYSGRHQTPPFCSPVLPGSSSSTSFIPQSHLKSLSTQCFFSPPPPLPIASSYVLEVPRAQGRFFKLCNFGSYVLCTPLFFKILHFAGRFFFLCRNHCVFSPSSRVFDRLPLFVFGISPFVFFPPPHGFSATFPPPGRGP